MTTKNEVRKEILNKRLLFSDTDVNEKSLQIFKKVYNMKDYKDSLNVMCYVDFKKEVSTRDFIIKAISDGKNVSVPFIPKTSDDNRIMYAAKITDYHSDLEVGAYGFLTPKKEILSFMEPEIIDLVIVPGVAFDAYGNRIGYGAGYYDRFLKMVRPDCLKIAVAFEIQIIDRIPAGVNDFPMDFIITEDRVI